MNTTEKHILNHGTSKDFGNIRIQKPVCGYLFLLNLMNVGPYSQHKSICILRQWIYIYKASVFNFSTFQSINNNNNIVKVEMFHSAICVYILIQMNYNDNSTQELMYFYLAPFMYKFHKET